MIETNWKPGRGEMNDIIALNHDYWVLSSVGIELVASAMHTAVQT